MNSGEKMTSNANHSVAGATRGRRLVHLFLIASVLIASGAFVGLGTDVEPVRSPGHLCTGKMTLPVEISIAGDESGVHPGASVVSASVTAQADIASAVARYVVTGPVVLDGPSSVDLGFL